MYGVWCMVYGVWLPFSAEATPPSPLGGRSGVAAGDYAMRAKREHACIKKEQGECKWLSRIYTSQYPDLYKKCDVYCGR